MSNHYIVETKCGAGWRCLCYEDEACTKQVVFPSHKQAADALMDMVIGLVVFVLKGEMPMSDMPKPGDFRITAIDQAVIDDGLELADCADAMSVIDAIRSKP